MDNKLLEKSRITELRDIMGFSQKDFADRVGITQGALSQIENGKSHASFDTIKKISDEFNVNCNWLIKGIGNVSLENSEAQNRVSLVQKSTQVNNKALIPFIKEEAHAGYINNNKDLEYIKALDVYQIPGFEKGNFRLFEVVGDSMLPTILPGEIVVCEFVGDPKSIINNELCVLITKEGIVAKRAYYYEEGQPSYILKSDNEKFKTYSVDANEVMEVWSIKAKITSMFQRPNDTRDARRIERLENDLNQLKDQVNSLKQSK